MARKIDINGTVYFKVNNDGVTETTGHAHKTRYDIAIIGNINANLTVNEHVIYANAATSRIITYNLPDSGTDGVYDGQEIIIRVMNSGSGVRVQCSTNGIRALGSGTVTTGLITLSQNQAYHYVYSSALGYWLGI
jgi:hypothetical protein